MFHSFMQWWMMVDVFSDVSTDYETSSFETSQNQRFFLAWKPRATKILHLAWVAAPAVWMSSASARWLRPRVHPVM